MSEHLDDPALSRSEIGDRAVRGAAVLALRGVLTRLLNFAGNVALARLLVPEDFGLVAIGLAVSAFATEAASGGMGAGLIRRAEAPERSDLRALLGAQLAATSVLGALIAAAALPLGEAGTITAIMMLALPLSSWRVPGGVMVERAMTYKPLLIVELAETLAFIAFSVTAAALGFGAYGLAAAYVARAAVGSLTMGWVAPIGLLRPAWSWERVRPLLRFGAQFQAVSVVVLVRDHGLNVGLAAVSGLTVVGLWVLANRILSVTLVVAGSLWRVSFPAMARLKALGDAAPVERMVRLVAVPLGALVVLLVAGAPGFVPAIFGPAWADAADVLPLCGLGALLHGPISTAVTGWLYAEGRAGTVLKATVIGAVTLVGGSLALAPALGIGAVGVAFAAACVVESLALALPVRAATGARIGRVLAGPYAAGAAGAIGGWWLTVALDATLGAAILGTAAGGAIFLAGLALLARDTLADVLALRRRLVPAAA